LVPIHESDLAENRWKDDEWRQFELWERIELRLRKKRGWIILGACFIFISILAAPVISDRLPKWRALHAMRALAVHANQMKVDAASLGVPLRLRIENSAEGPLYLIERVDRCDSPSQIKVWGGGTIFSEPSRGSQFSIFDPKDAGSEGLERVTTAVCYDPLSVEEAKPVQALGILTVKDLAERRLDRIAFLNFSGLFAEIDFD